MYNEDADEGMDAAPSTENLDDEYDSILANNRVFSIDEIETKQLSNSSNIGVNELTKDALLKKASNKSVNDFEIGGVDNSNNDDIKDTTSEGSEAKSAMSLNSRNFTPKNQSSTKSIEDFDISNDDSKKSTEDSKGIFKPYFLTIS